MNYTLLDSGNRRRLEKFGDYILDRPDPEVLWNKELSEDEWQKADARFDKTWTIVNKIPEKWIIEHEGVKLLCKLAPFKHTGVFPEQAWQWSQIYKLISKSKNKNTNVLNLFAYTGAATMFASKAGAKVTHVDASKPAVTWASENRDLNGLTSKPIRWIVDDALKFTEREAKRGVKYDGIIMDPPVYGHGPGGKPWDFSKDFPNLLKNCTQILSDKPIFLFVNAYAISSSPLTLANTIQGLLGDIGGKIDSGEHTLKESSAGRLLSTGIWSSWIK